MVKKTGQSREKKQGRQEKKAHVFSNETLTAIKKRFEADKRGVEIDTDSDEERFRKYAEKLLDEARKRRKEKANGTWRGGRGEDSWGLVFLNAIHAALVAKIDMPHWVAHELFDMLEIITAEQAKDGWNDEKIFGNPYEKGVKRGKRGLDCMASCEIEALINSEEFIREHGHKNAETRDRIAAKILNSKHKELRLTGRTVKEYRNEGERRKSALINALQKKYPELDD